MTNHSNRAGKFLRNSLSGTTNKVTDPFLSKLEDKINSLGQYIQQRHGQEAYDNLLNHVSSDEQ